MFEGGLEGRNQLVEKGAGRALGSKEENRAAVVGSVEPLLACGRHLRCAGMALGCEHGQPAYTEVLELDVAVDSRQREIHMGASKLRHALRRPAGGHRA